MSQKKSMVKKHRRISSTENKSYTKDFYHRPGTIPGTLFVDENALPPKIFLIDYTQTDVIHKQLKAPEECTLYLDKNSVSWVDVQGLGSAEILERLAQIFELHPLMLEDMVNAPERPKIEEDEDQLLIVARMVVPKEAVCGFYSEQVSFVLGGNYVLTVQEEPEHDCFHPVRARINYNKGTIRKRQSDYLAYALLDAIIDGFFPVLERYGERLEELEEEVMVNPNRRTLQEIYEIRRELLQLRRAIWPQRDVINSLIRDGYELISDEVRVYLRDCYDHTVQIMDMVETYRELASGLMDVYLSAVSNRMNEIMKVLTVVSSIFIPLTFIAGVYGMNFERMPELKFYWGYPICISAMAAIALGLLFFFWRRGWLENASTIKHD
jgi:magnesium transporter